MNSEKLLKLLLVFLSFFVLVALTLPNPIGRGPVRSNAPKLLIQGIEQAVDIYAVDHDGRFPTTRQGLQVLIERPPDDPNWKGPYLKSGLTEVPQLEFANDPWGTPIRYEVTVLDNGRRRMRLWSLGPDKLPDTGDEIGVDRIYPAIPKPAKLRDSTPTIEGAKQGTTETPRPANRDEVPQ